MALVNGVNFHFEVLSGLLHVLQPYEKYIDVYLSPYSRTANFDGAWDLVRWSRAKFLRTDAKHMREYDIVLLVSPDYELQTNEHLIRQMNPRLTICIVHNSDLQQLPVLLSLSPSMELLTMAPHVAASLGNSTKRSVDWVLASYPFKPQPQPSCGDAVSEEQVLGMCLRGFAMQGKFSNLRRNYSSMWNQMVDRLDVINDPQVSKLFHMNVLGKGPDRLALPPSLEPLVTVHRRKAYRTFYEIIGRNIGLVPSLASDRYYTDKFSSTVITSLMTLAPMVAGGRMLSAYSFLPREAVFVQGEGESEVDAMIRIARMGVKEVVGVRQALAKVREDLNQQAIKKLEVYIGRMCEANGKEWQAAREEARRSKKKQKAHRAKGSRSMLALSLERDDAVQEGGVHEMDE